jgi:hypothetical protein
MADNTTPIPVGSLTPAPDPSQPNAQQVLAQAHESSNHAHRHR